VDESCLGFFVRSGFGGIIRTTFGQKPSFDEIVCYFDFLYCVSLINGHQVKYHIHVVLI
jgi:hypothetical protein